MTPQQQAAAARRSVGLFRLPHRGVLAVEGSDRSRWLNGMLTNDVAALAPGESCSGCHAALLTPKGRIVADLHVLHRGDCFWLELERDAIADVAERLDRYIIADDVKLRDLSQEWLRIAVEGPAAAAVIGRATGADLDPLAPESVVDARVGGVDVVLGRFGFSGAAAFQLFVAAEEATAVEAALRDAGTPDEIIQGDPAALEILRVEAGIPRLGAEIDEEVLLDEARLEHTVSMTKGCYTGQEIVARLRSRGRVNHQLVGMRFAGTAAPPVGSEVWADGKRSGEITSAVTSPREGAIGLGFVRRVHAEAGTKLQVGVSGGAEAEVVALPFPVVQSAAEPAEDADVPGSGG